MTNTAITSALAAILLLLMLPGCSDDIYACDDYADPTDLEMCLAGHGLTPNEIKRYKAACTAALAKADDVLETLMDIKKADPDRCSKISQKETEAIAMIDAALCDKLKSTRAQRDNQKKQVDERIAAKRKEMECHAAAPIGYITYPADDVTVVGTCVDGVCN